MRERERKKMIVGEIDSREADEINQNFVIKIVTKDETRHFLCLIQRVL